MEFFKNKIVKYFNIGKLFIWQIIFFCHFFCIFKMDKEIYIFLISVLVWEPTYFMFYNITISMSPFWAIARLLQKHLFMIIIPYTQCPTTTLQEF